MIHGKPPFKSGSLQFGKAKTMINDMIRVKLDELPEDLKKEVLDYVEFLLQKYGRKRKRGTFRFDWEGGLSDLKEQYTSVELQHKVSEWR